MAQTTTNLGKIHVFPSETLYNQFKNLVADNDLALLKDDGAYIIAANLAQNGYVKFSNGLILQWGLINAEKTAIAFPVAFLSSCFTISITAVYTNQAWSYPVVAQSITRSSFVARTQSNWRADDTARYIAVGM